MSLLRSIHPFLTYILMVFTLSHCSARESNEFKPSIIRDVGRAVETLSGGNSKSCCESRVSSWFARYEFSCTRTYTHEITYERRDRVVHNEKQRVERSHCEINEFFTIGTLTATDWVSRSVEPFMTMMRTIPRNDRNTIE